MTAHNFSSTHTCFRCAQNDKTSEPECPSFCSECGEAVFGYLNCKCGESGEAKALKRREIVMQLERACEAVRQSNNNVEVASAQVVEATAAVERAEAYVDDLKSTIEAWKLKAQELQLKLEQTGGKGAPWVNIQQPG